MSELTLRENSPQVAAAMLVEAAKQMASGAATYDEVEAIENRKAMPPDMREAFILDMCKEAWGKFVAAVQEEPMLVMFSDIAKKRGVSPNIPVEAVRDAIHENTQYRCSSGMVKSAVRKSQHMTHNKYQDTVQVRLSRDARKMLDRIRSYYDDAENRLREARRDVVRKSMDVPPGAIVRSSWRGEITIELHQNTVENAIQDAFASAAASEDEELTKVLREYQTAKTVVEAIEEFKSARTEVV